MRQAKKSLEKGVFFGSAFFLLPKVFFMGPRYCLEQPHRVRAEGVNGIRTAPGGLEDAIGACQPLTAAGSWNKHSYTMLCLSIPKDSLKIF